MATITTFEELEVWKLSRAQVVDFNSLIEQTSLCKDYELRNQMNAASGSVMDNIAEGFERAGNIEFKNFLVIAKGSNGEFRSQLYRCLDRGHISQETFDGLYQKNMTISSKLMSFILYLHHSSLKGQNRKPKDTTT